MKTAGSIFLLIACELYSIYHIQRYHERGEIYNRHGGWQKVGEDTSVIAYFPVFMAWLTLILFSVLLVLFLVTIIKKNTPK